MVGHHPGCLWYRGNCRMQGVIAYVWMVPIVVGYMVHLLAYAPGGCLRLFTLSCMCSWMHCLNCTLDIGCDIWFVFYREVFGLSRVLGPDKPLGEATFCDWEIVIQANCVQIGPVIHSQLWAKKSWWYKSSQVEACFNTSDPELILCLSLLALLTCCKLLSEAIELYM